MNHQNFLCFCLVLWFCCCCIIATVAFKPPALSLRRERIVSSSSSSSSRFLSDKKAATAENGNIKVHNEEVIDDDDDITPYLNRTIGWTRRYRKLVPYEAARRTAMRLGLRSKEEWEDIREFGKAFHGAHAVSRPDLMYAKEWISWEEFLGVMRPYEEARDIVQNQLGLKTMEEYREWVSQNVKKAEDLRIPAKPDIVYRNKGWEGPEAFFGSQ